MKHTTGLIASFIAAALMVSRPAFADVVPARTAKAERDAAEVERRLKSLGADAPSARLSLDRLTSDEVRFFAEDPSRVQAVGGLTWYEVGGGLAIGGAMALAVFLLANHAAQ